MKVLYLIIGIWLEMIRESISLLVNSIECQPGYYAYGIRTKYKSLMLSDDPSLRRYATV